MFREIEMHTGRYFLQYNQISMVSIGLL